LPKEQSFQSKTKSKNVWIRKLWWNDFVCKNVGGAGIITNENQKKKFYFSSVRNLTDERVVLIDLFF
jgi:hypothetical protein